MAFDRTKNNRKTPRESRQERTGQNKTESRDYSRFEYKNPSSGVQRSNERSQNSENERDQYILTGRNPIREALKNHHDLEKLLVQKGELSGSAREIVQKAKEQMLQPISIQPLKKSWIQQRAGEKILLSFFWTE